MWDIINTLDLSVSQLDTRHSKGFWRTRLKVLRQLPRLLVVTKFINIFFFNIYCPIKMSILNLHKNSCYLNFWTSKMQNRLILHLLPTHCYISILILCLVMFFIGIIYYNINYHRDRVGVTTCIYLNNGFWIS